MGTKKDISSEWKINTPKFLSEIFNNPGMGIFHVPVVIFSGLLEQVATRASQLNDPELNKLMCRLALYQIADPYSKGYDRAKVKEILETKPEPVIPPV